jgi:branched-chain amino acid transport system substrate-binding protein
VRRVINIILAAAALLPATASAQAKIAFMDVLSGPFAVPGQTALRHFQFKAEELNAKGGLAGERIEIVPMDNKGSPSETVALLKSAIDGGIRYVAQGGGSGVALALVDAINKHNERNPAQAILYLGYAAQDPALTNEKCSYWHFRFDANAEMKLEALTSQMAKDPGIKRVYIIGQNYSHGQQVSRHAKEQLARRRPDIQIVGDDLHPLGQVKDFAPYVQKIITSRADAVITGNWGADMSLLVKSARESGLHASFWTIFGYGPGNLQAMGDTAAGRVKTATIWHHNARTPGLEKQMLAFRQKYGAGYDLFFPQVFTMMDMLAQAAAAAKSVDPSKVAPLLEGRRFKTEMGEVQMRASDHQLLLPVYVTTLEKSAARGGAKEVRYDAEGSGLGPREDVRNDPFVSATPTSCQMKRPGA